MQIHSLKTWVGIAALSCALFSQSLFAQDFKVGRVTIKFTDSGWLATEVPDNGVPYTGDISGTIASETRIFVNQTSGGDVVAVLIASASKGGISNGYMTYSPTCADRRAMLVEGNSGAQLSYAECLIVYPLFTTSSVLKNLSETESLILKSAKMKLPDTMQLIQAIYANSNGSHMRARIMFAPGFVGLKPQAATAEDPVFSWSREFLRAVRGGVNSFRGHVTIPAIEVKPPSPEKAIVQTSSNAAKPM
jgi:hypothetical protein